jgi:hypothetical protein
MRVKNKLTGNTSHVKNNDRDTLFGIKMGLLEVVDSTPDYKTGDVVHVPGRGVFPAMQPADLTPRWSVTENRAGNYQITLTRGNTVLRFDGYPKDAANCFDIPTPKHILADYKANKVMTSEDRFRAG